MNQFRSGLLALGKWNDPPAWGWYVVEIVLIVFGASIALYTLADASSQEWWRKLIIAGGGVVALFAGILFFRTNWERRLDLRDRRLLHALREHSFLILENGTDTVNAEFEEIRRKYISEQRGLRRHDAHLIELSRDSFHEMLEQVLQCPPPVFEDYALTIVLTGFEWYDGSGQKVSNSDPAKRWQIAVLKCTVSYSVDLRKQAVSIGKLCPPLLVTTSRAILAEPVLNLERRRMAGLYYPIQHPWIAQGDWNGLQQIDWLSRDAVSVAIRGPAALDSSNTNDVEVTQPAGSVTKTKRFDMMSFTNTTSAKDLLKDCGISEKISSDAEAHLRECLVGAIRPGCGEARLLPSESDGKESVSYEMTQRLCIARFGDDDGCQGSYLFRYEVPFRAPTFVKFLEFRVAGGVGATLDPCGCWHPSPPSDKDRMYDQRHQRLEWPEGVLFLRGSGVVFAWMSDRDDE